MNKKIIKVKLSPKLNAIIIDFIMRNISTKSSVEFKNVCLEEKDEVGKIDIPAFTCSEYPGHIPMESDCNGLGVKRGGSTLNEIFQ
jgi:hypothetical protein